MFHPEYRSRTTQDLILTAFADRLREYAPFAGAVTVITDQPIPLVMPQGKRAVTVSPGPGNFPDQMWSGGHHRTATEDGSVVVSVFIQNLGDRPGKKPVGMSDLVEFKRKVLQQLTVENYGDQENAQPWEPTIDVRRPDEVVAGAPERFKPLLREIPLPKRVTAVSDVPDHKGWIGFQMTFACTWDWDLYV